MENRKQIFHNINFLRCVLTLIIVYFHTLAGIISTIDPSPIYLEYKAQCGYSVLSVDCFFIMGGFFLYQGFVNGSGNFTQFLVKRILRLWPVLAFATFLEIFLLKVNLFSAVYRVLFLHCIGLSLEYTGIHWYISPYFWGGVILYLLIKAVEKNKALETLSLLVITYFCYLVNIISTEGGLGRETVYGIANLPLARSVGGAALGCLLYKISQSLRTLKLEIPVSGTVRSLFFTLLELVLIYALIRYFLFGSHHKSHFIVVVLFSLLFLCFTHCAGWVSRLLNQRIFTAFGKYTYSVYVMQQSCFCILTRTLWKTGITDNFFLCIFLSVLACLTAGALVYHTIEKPFYNIIKIK